MINERGFLELIWQYKLFGNKILTLVDGRRVRVISSGHRSNGDRERVPDFVFAQLELIDSGVIIHGNVRIDSKSSDWKNIADESFSGVQLHFVGEFDSISMQNGITIPTLCAPTIEYLHDNASRVAAECHHFLSQMESVHQEHIFARMESERLERKSGEVLALLPTVDNNWDKLAVVFLIMSFGYGSSKRPYGQLSRMVPMEAIVADMIDRESLEAILLSLAGFLTDSVVLDSYSLRLRERYNELSKKYRISGRVSLRGNTSYRPQSNPQLQLARLAAILGENGSFWKRLLNETDYVAVREIFSLPLGEYWKSHLTLGSESSRGTSVMTPKRVDGLIINFVVPLLHAYGQWLDDQDLKERAIEFLNMTSPEENRLITGWSTLDFTPMNSYQTQALLEISKMYCAKGGSRCYECPVGAAVVLDYYKRYCKALGIK